MRKKKGFTLLEVMVALSIFSILSLMITAMLIQSQKILAKTDNSANIQNEVRTVLLKIQNEAKKYNEVVVNNKYGNFTGDKWELVEGDTSARELLRFSNDGEDIAKVYVEVNKDNKHQLIELDIEGGDKSSSTIKNTNVLISNINGDGVNAIAVRLLGENENNQLITIDCSSMITEEGVNKTNYIASFSKKIVKDIDLPNDGGGEMVGDNVTDDEEEEEEENILDVAAWDSNKVYSGGEIIYYNGVIYKAAWYSHGSNPEIGDAWIIISQEPTEWKSTKVYLTDQKVIYNGKIYKAKWYAHAGLKPGENYCWELVN